MPELPERPDLDQLRRQARELHRAAQSGDADAIARMRQVSDDVSLSAAQLAIAREYGFSGWPALKSAVEDRASATAQTDAGASIDNLVKCSFCGKSRRHVNKVIAGPGVYICSECVGLCQEILEEENVSAGKRRAEPGAVDRSNPPKILEGPDGVSVCVRLAEQPGPWTREYPALARMMGLQSTVEEEAGRLSLRVRLEDVPQEREVFDALDRALRLVGDAKEVARSHETVANRAQRLVDRWWQQKARN